ncbi:hypothetical protein [uncultured Tenacibaculum sp.]|uniref:hypothetical protein n=1 Tax=uncultured Tenacibaculum sp. TaxID=174713 RepID=UPI00261FC03C|nr:hypothetical protein [uncultured Tenacibaculum sp.]
MRNLFNYCIAILFLNVFISCSNESEINENKFTAKDFEFVGIEHNKILEETFKILKEEKSMLKAKKRQNENQFKDVLIRATSNVYKNDKIKKDFAISGVHNFFKIEEPNSFSKRRNDVDSFENTISSLSLSEQNYMNQLGEIMKEMDSPDLEKNEIINDIIELEVKIGNDSNLNNEQLQVLYSATQTSKYSFSYWKENANDWVISLEDHDIDHTISFSSKNRKRPICRCGRPAKFIEAVGDVSSADAAGAIGGAVGAAAVNVVIGPGQVAYGSAIVGTAATASATVVARKIIDWLRS